ncbi:DUF1634 domain-containing protein [Mucilaginibacter sp. RS28]|uniref:DUF1634 domain-containing protein n=1 Tax=Mucilaginibacter straminoryzae TaxID=2932774 RepID=A0A9X1X1Y1_9SPHI|nr:DUF1634 domain-containing protein [Mucilaginibacter straminoryzae]MCJ8209351.1 DUF1634 domain-containing protein [Mucilaginibacter straminoryzae]
MAGSNFKDKNIQDVIGWVLRGGVIVSMAVVFIGGVIYLYRHGSSTVSYRQFQGVPAFVQSIGGIINGILNLRGRAIIQAGIILLIATPVVRVIFSAIGFILEKDYLYTAITLFVLLVIIIGMLTGRGG